MGIPLHGIQRLAFFAAFCVAWFNVGFPRPVEALGVQKKTVLVLYGDPLLVPADRMTEQGLTAALLSAHGSNLEVFSEYLDLQRFPAARYGDDIVRYLRARYGTRKPDVLITLANTALQFVLDHRDELFPGVPIVFSSLDHREVEGKEMPPNVSGLWMAWDYQRTLELALKLQPQTREVVCVSGTGEEEQPWNKEARKVLEPERIFERFFSTKREGIGMGLAIARSIIVSHGGELAAGNAEGGGVCLYFLLPVIAKRQRG